MSIVEIGEDKSKCDNNKHKSWITDNILKLMDLHRSYKNKNQIQPSKSLRKPNTTKRYQRYYQSDLRLEKERKNG